MVISNKELEEVRDSNLDGLLHQLNDIQAKILRRRIFEARQKGEVVLTVDELVCETHPDSGFEKRPMGTSQTTAQYFCDGWNYVGEYGDQSKISLCKEEGPSSQTKAYECNNCGIVYGETVNRIRPEGSHERWYDELHHCRVCDTLVAVTQNRPYD